MRQYFADGFSYDDSVAHPVTFRNSLGHTFELHILADNVIKVRHSLGKDAIMPPAAAGCQFQTSVHTEGQEMTVETNLVRVSIKLPQFLLAWYSKETGECFSQDCAVRAYAYNDKQMWHYRKRFPSDRYVGLGERTGNLVLNGRRFRVEPRTDSMGYDAESQDPLYKYHPVLLTLNKRITHGLYYSRMGGAVTFDLNAEFDAVSFSHLLSEMADKVYRRFLNHDYYYHLDVGPLLLLSNRWRSRDGIHDGLWSYGA